jgi:hypothetical protein
MYDLAYMAGFFDGEGSIGIYRNRGSKYIYSWLIQNNFPGGYQVLCHNCNMAKAFYKVCPHKEVK